MAFLKALRACAAAAMLLAGASVGAAQAATVDVTFDFVGEDDSSVGSGAFSYDASKTGVIGFGDLNSFSIDMLTSTYDLSFVTDAGKSFSSWWGMSFDTESMSFVSQSAYGYSYIMAALVDTFDSGFFVRDDTYTVARDYPNGDKYFSHVDVSATTSGDVSSVPLPAPALMLLAALGALAAFGLRRRSRAPVAA